MLFAFPFKILSKGRRSAFACCRDTKTVRWFFANLRQRPIKRINFPSKMNKFSLNFWSHQSQDCEYPTIVSYRHVLHTWIVFANISLHFPLGAVRRYSERWSDFPTGMRWFIEFLYCADSRSRNHRESKTAAESSFEGAAVKSCSRLLAKSLSSSRVWGIPESRIKSCQQQTNRLMRFAQRDFFLLFISLQSD